MTLALVPIDPPARRRFPLRVIFTLILGLAVAGAWWFVVEVKKLRVAAARMADT